jgi:IPT/TIG domain-containing protein
MTLGTTLPFGLRDVKLIAYPSLAATAFGTQLIDLPNAQTFDFTETEEYVELRGDDTLVTSHGQGPTLDCSLESGGISTDAYKIINGGTVVESGVTPNQVKRYRKKVTDQRPFFTVVGQSISDSGGDIWSVVYRCRATGDLSGEFSDGAFFIPTADITGFGCLVSGLVDGNEINGTLYDFVQHETVTTITAPIIDVAAAPTVLSLSDVTGPAAGGEIVTITGTSFIGVTGITFGGTAATDYEVVDPNHIVAVAPAHAAGAVAVVVTNATGSSSASLTAANTYTYV